MMNKNMSIRIAVGLVAFAVTAGGVRAADVTVGADVNTAYMWRGLTFNDEGVIQPSVDISHDSGLGLNVWGNWDLGDYDGAVESAQFSEIDITASYAIPVEGLDLSVGVIAYTFPQGGADSNTHEAYVDAGVGLTDDLSVGVAVYYDFDEVEDFYGNASAAYGIPVNDELSLEVSGSIGYAGDDFAAIYAGGTDGGFFDWNAKLSAAYAASETVELGAFVAYTDNVDSDALPSAAQDVDVYGGGSVYYSF